jgi:hypothetical protein
VRVDQVPAAKVAGGKLRTVAAALAVAGAVAVTGVAAVALAVAGKRAKY